MGCEERTWKVERRAGESSGRAEMRGKTVVGKQSEKEGCEAESVMIF